MEEVPAVKIDGHTLINSIAIMYYLDETRPEPPLLPNEFYDRAKVRQTVQIICSSIQPLHNLAVLNRVGAQMKYKWVKHWIKRGFRARSFYTTSVKCCVGDTITMADCCLVPQVHFAKSYNVDVSRYTKILCINNELVIYPAFCVTHPLNQPDGPSE